MKMFAIDLLKGQGIPVRSRPENIAATVMTLAIPAIIAVIMFVYYMHNSIVISIQRREMANYETMTNKLTDAVALQKAFEDKKKVVNGCLSEVGTNIGKYTQWTPVIVETVKNMPDSMVLTGINVNEENLQKSVLSKKGETVNITIPVKTLQISVSENSGFAYGQAIRDFEDRLRVSPVFSPRLDNINVSQDVDKFTGEGVTSYQINCSFKPTL